MGRIRIGIITVLFSLFFMVGVFAGDETQFMCLGGKIYYTQPPVVMDGDFLIEGRSAFETMGYTVKWDSSSQEMTVLSPYDESYVYKINDSTMYVNGVPVVMKTFPRLINNRVMVPLSGIYKGLGQAVIYQADENIFYFVGRIITDKPYTFEIVATSDSEEIPVTDDSKDILTLISEGVAKSAAATKTVPSMEDDIYTSQTQTQAGIEAQKRLEDSFDAEYKKFKEIWIGTKDLQRLYNIQVNIESEKDPSVTFLKDGKTLLVIKDTPKGSWPNSQIKIGDVTTKYFKEFEYANESANVFQRMFKRDELFDAIKEYSGVVLVPIQDNNELQQSLADISREWISADDLKEQYKLNVKVMVRNFEIRNEDGKVLFFHDYAPYTGTITSQHSLFETPDMSEWPDTPFELEGLRVWYIEEIDGVYVNKIFVNKADLAAKGII